MEEIFSISHPWTLNGVWSDGGQPHRPAVVFLSAGLLRSPGPNRLYVECARQLATRGISSLRFDLSGIGDSLERSNHASIRSKTLAEVQEVFNALSEQKNINRFVLVGLCSGAYDGIDIALQDQRVVSVVSLDGYSVKTKWFKFYWFKTLVLPRLLQKSTWLNQLSRLTGNNTYDQSETHVVAADLFLETEEPEKIIKRLTELLSRKVQLFCLFTGGFIEEYSYLGQLADADPAIADSPHMTEVYFPEIDHLLLLDQDRAKVVDAVVDHVQSIE